MLISDWSSDVCSSYLFRAGVPAASRRRYDAPVRARKPCVAARRKPAHGGGHDTRGVAFPIAGSNHLASDAHRPALTAHPLRSRGWQPILWASTMAGTAHPKELSMTDPKTEKTLDPKIGRAHV